MAEEIIEGVNVEANTPAVEAAGENANAKENKGRQKPKKDFKRDGRGRNDRRREDDGLDKVTVQIRRVTKVVKGGRTMRFSAMVVVGDKKGKIGIGIGKAAEVPQAIDKAVAYAKKHMKEVTIVNGTIAHETVGKFSASKITLFPAKEGTGIIAGASARAVLELAGITDVVTKVHGSTNKINVVKATYAGLVGLRTKEEIEAIRNITLD